MHEIKVVDFRDSDAPARFTASLKEIGFGVLSHHPIPVPLIQEVYGLWWDYFTKEAQADFAFDPKTHDGHSSLELSETAKGYRIKDLKEFYHYYPWGRCPEKQKAKTQALYEALDALAKTLLQWVENFTPTEIKSQFSEPLSHMIEGCDRTLFRILHYPPLKGDEPANAIRAAAHEDINLLTLLPAATADGLQVLNKEGRWIDVPINPSWIIVNVGDMLQEATEFYYPSTTHRVKNPVGESAKLPRLSMPLFLHARSEVQLSERYTAESYRQERYAELGLV